MVIKLRWVPDPNSDVASYKLCRSFIGFIALKPLGSIDGKILELKFNNGPLQTITFNDIDPIIDQINVVIVGNGGQAFDSLLDAGNFIVRSDIREGVNGKVEIVGGNAMVDLGLTARVIIEKSEEYLIATLPALPDPTTVVSFEDEDGVPEDWYRLSTVSSLNVESQKTQYKQAISFTGAICVIEGIVTDLQGVRLCDIKVEAKMVKTPQSTVIPTFVSTDTISVLTGSDGRFSLPLLQGAQVQISIKDIGLVKTICVPEKAFEYLQNIPYDTSHQYQPGAN
jgi:hypothetical protein